MGVTLGAAIGGLEAEHGPTPYRVVETVLYILVAAASESVSLLFLQIVMGKSSFCLPVPPPALRHHRSRVQRVLRA